LKRVLDDFPGWQIAVWIFAPATNETQIRVAGVPPHADCEFSAIKRSGTTFPALLSRGLDVSIEPVGN
jgi:hypothetical protein